MSNHPSNRDTALDRAWREASAELPPSHLDAAIIAAARKSVLHRGDNTIPGRVASRNWLTRLQPLAAAAGLAGLAFVLVQMLPRENDLAPPIQRRDSAPVPSSAELGSRSSSAREDTDGTRGPRADGTVDLRERVAAPDRAPAQNAVPAPPSATASSATKADAATSNSAPTSPVPPTTTAAEATSNHAPTAGTASTLGEFSADRRKAVGSEMAGRSATSAASAPSSSALGGNLGDAAPLDAATWAAKVVSLHESGDVTAAEHELRAFRAAEPEADTYLPESLRNWARTVE